MHYKDPHLVSNTIYQIKRSRIKKLLDLQKYIRKNFPIFVISESRGHQTVSNLKNISNFSKKFLESTHGYLYLPKNDIKAKLTRI